ncbi:hypothetical protein ACTXY8_28095 [Pseudomonas aeruginosa]
MKTTLLKHHKALGYLKTRELVELPADLNLPVDTASLITFRGSRQAKPTQVIKNVHAAVRPLSLFGDGSYALYGLQSDSPLAPLLMWDAAHFLAVGQHLTVIEDSPMACYLDREYFRSGLVVESRTATEITYKKVAKLAAETDDDLDSWTFGIPVGPEDATVLNAVVKRILEIDIPNKEIILCGTPGQNFAYFDQVRIVGEDITAPPVQICKKKNRLAQEATYNNLVILHDRVFLPKNFGEVVRHFGPRYPLMTLQSMFFDNRVSMHPRRYSDYGMALGDIANGLQGLHRSSGQAVSIAPSIFSEVERTGFSFASPMRYNNDRNYTTGSLYICRREVWNAYPLDESLFWVEYEDIEHAIRASKAGVPSRINAHGITQSITSRALLGAKACVEFSNGKFGYSTPNYFSSLPKKPLLKMTSAAALARLRVFAEKYVISIDALHIPSGWVDIPPIKWIALVNHVIRQSSVKHELQSVKNFIADYEKLVLLDQLTDSQRELLVAAFVSDPQAAKDRLIIASTGVRTMLHQRPLQCWFYRSQAEYFHSNYLSLFGIFLSSLNLYLANGKVFYFNGLIQTIKSVYLSTPFKRYLEK